MLGNVELGHSSYFEFGRAAARRRSLVPGGLADVTRSRLGPKLSGRPSVPQLTKHLFSLWTPSKGSTLISTANFVCFRPTEYNCIHGSSFDSKTTLFEQTVYHFPFPKTLSLNRPKPWSVGSLGNFSTPPGVVGSRGWRRRLLPQAAAHYKAA